MAENGENKEVENEGSSNWNRIKVSPRWQKMGLAILSIVFYILLIDLAVETFLSGSPLRWWVGIIVVAFLVLSIALFWKGKDLWQRIGWSTKAVIPFFVLLGLITLTAWLPDGTSQGIVILDQSTSTLLKIITGLAIVFSGIILIRFLWSTHLAIKCLIGILAIYGVAAFLIGIITEIPYNEMFQGDSFWSSLPQWLQGAFIGTLTIPLALVALIINGIMRIRGRLLLPWGYKVISLSLSLLLVISSVRFTTGVTAVNIAKGPDRGINERTEAATGDRNPDQGAEGSGGKTAGEETQLTRKEAREKLENLFDALEAAKHDLPRDTFDINAVIENVGSEPSELFEWVHEYTALVPYQGVLRGHKGVLMDRVGNSLDRALLLHALLSKAGQKVRLAHGALSEQEAKELWKKLPPIPQIGVIDSSDPSSESLDKLLEQYAKQYDLDLYQLRQLIKKNTKDQERIAKQVSERVAKQTSELEDAIGLRKKGQNDSGWARQVEAIRDHWWVQWWDGSSWVDMDPTLPDSKPGQFLTNAKETIQPQKLNADLIHSVVIRVIVEYLESGQRKEKRVMEHSLIPANLIGERIALHHFPLDWPTDLNLFQEKDPTKKLKQVVLSQKEWLPVLTVGSDQIFNYSFSSSGEIFDATDQNYLRSRLGGLFGVEGKIKDATRIFEGLGGRQEKAKHKEIKESESPQQVLLTGEWIEYEIRSPGRSPKTIRRQIFDLLGPAARSSGNFSDFKTNDQKRLQRGLALLTKTEILPLVSQISPEFLAYLITDGLLANRTMLLNLVSEQNSANFEELNKILAQAKLLPGPAYILALAMRGWLTLSDQVYLGQCNILSYHNGSGLNQQGGIVGFEAFDIVANDVEVSAKSPRNPSVVRLRQGILDTNSEAMLGSAICENKGMKNCAQLMNTANLYSESIERGKEWVVIRSVKDSSVKDLRLPKDVRARIEQDLRQGYIIVAPQKVPALNGQDQIGWWRIDQRSGNTLGIDKNGWGAGTAEYVILNMRIVGQMAGLLFCSLSSMDEYDRMSTTSSWLCGLGFVISFPPLFIPLVAPSAVGATTVLVTEIATLISIFLYGIGSLT